MTKPAIVINISEVKKDKLILVVEDNLVNQRLVKVLLEPLPYTIEFANHGREAIDKVEAINYSLIFMDIQMPVMDGLEASKYIKFILKKNIPIIGLTANVYDDNIQKCKKSGMDDFLGKPFSQEELFNIIDKWLEGVE